MKSYLIVFLTVIGATAVLSLSACSSRGKGPSPDEIQQQITEFRKQESELVLATVTDADRAERYLKLISDRERLLTRRTEEIMAHNEKMTVLLLDYNAKRSDFELLLAEFNRQRVSTQTQLLELGESMKRTTTDEEWRVIASFQLKNPHPRQLSYDTAEQGG